MKPKILRVDSASYVFRVDDIIADPKAVGEWVTEWFSNNYGMPIDTTNVEVHLTFKGYEEEE